MLTDTRIEAVASAEAERPTRGRSLWLDAGRRFMANRAAMVSLVVLLSVVLFTIIGPFFARWSIEKVDWSAEARKGIDPSVIIPGGRSSRRRDLGGAYAVYLGTFATMLENPVSMRTEPSIIQIHRDQLRDPPRRWSQLKTHPHREEFKKAT